MIAGLPDDQKPKTAAYVTQDDPFAAPVIESMQAQLEAIGVETVYSEVYPPETTNLQPFASKIAAAQPDLIAQGAVFEDGVSLVKSLVQVGYNPKIMFQTSAPSNGAQFTDAIGTGNEEGIFYAVSWTEKSPTPGNAEFIATYRGAERRGTGPGRGCGGCLRGGGGPRHCGGGHRWAGQPDPEGLAARELRVDHPRRPLVG